MAAMRNRRFIVQQLAHVACRFLRNDEGVTAIEYALLAALIAIAIFGSVAVFGVQLGNLYAHIKDCVLSPSTC